MDKLSIREQPKAKEELAGELAVAALYLLQLSSVSSIDLEEAIIKKIAMNKIIEWDVEE